jgi:hypothetical protein
VAGVEVVDAPSLVLAVADVVFVVEAMKAAVTKLLFKGGDGEGAMGGWLARSYSGFRRRQV